MHSSQCFLLAEPKSKVKIKIWLGSVKLMIPDLCMFLISCFLISSVTGGKNHMKNYFDLLPLTKE